MMDLKHCGGCDNDFYNGNNGLGVKECWSRQTAKLIPRVCVHISQMPPWTQPAKPTPDCYHVPQFVHVSPDNPSCMEAPRTGLPGEWCPGCGADLSGKNVDAPCGCGAVH